MGKLMKKTLTIALLCAVTAIASCGPSPELAFTGNTAPAQWTKEEIASLNANGPLSACSHYTRGVWYTGKGIQPYTTADFKVLEGILRGGGLSARDVELLRKRNQSYGTGQTFMGLVCSLGYEPSVNKSFYPGTGHQWQAVLWSDSYVYLEGDGTVGDMRVKSWN